MMVGYQFQRVATGPEEQQPGKTSLQGYVPEGGGRAIKGNDQSLII